MHTQIEFKEHVLRSFSAHAHASATPAHNEFCILHREPTDPYSRVFVDQFCPACLSMRFFLVVSASSLCCVVVFGNMVIVLKDIVSKNKRLENLQNEYPSESLWVFRCPLLVFIYVVHFCFVHSTHLIHQTSPNKKQRTDSQKRKHNRLAHYR